GLCEQRQRRQANEEPIGWRAGVLPEDGRERVALRSRKPLRLSEHPRAELMEAAIGELHLRFDTDSSRDPAALRSIAEIVQQGALSDPRFPAEDRDPALAEARVGQDP